MYPCLTKFSVVLCQGAVPGFESPSRSTPSLRTSQSVSNSLAAITGNAALLLHVDVVRGIVFLMLL